MMKGMKSLLRNPLAELIGLANKVRENYIGNRFELCSIINAKSGLCGQDCKFCAQSSRHPTNIQVYPVKGEEEIVEAARRAKEIGAARFGIVTSGKKVNNKELDIIARSIFEIRTKLNIAVCSSLGNLKRSELEMLKAAGLSRYHHNIETSCRFFPQIVSTHSFQERIDTIVAAKEAGLEICSGGIIGMGETWQDRIDMARLLRDLEVDSVPINILIPIKGTALEKIKPVNCGDVIRTIAIFRIILKDKIIKIAAGRESLLKDFQAMAFMAGANGMLIGGYLTVKGRDIEEDHKLVEEIKRMWTK